jgi:uracil-DNA glycosylase
MVYAVIEPSYEAWHEQARALLAAAIPPEDVVWAESEAAQPLLDGAAAPAPQSATGRVTVPRKFVGLATLAAHYRPRPWALLYRILWRLVREHRALLDNVLDSDAIELLRIARAVRQDVERMKAFVRFRAIGPHGGERFVAWHVPDHDVVSLVAPHFAKRYPNMRWSIFTPARSVHWDGQEVTFGAGVPASAIPTIDSDRAAEGLWRTYYTAAFNPARVNEKKLARDMPERFRERLPEAAAIPALIAKAPSRTRVLRGSSGGTTARALVPDTRDLTVLRDAVPDCTACELYKHATQPVFGQGPASAAIVLVGEQPGDAEDLAGRPFVGPAGELLDRALAEAGIARSEVYVTNAVKHFAWEPRGKRRIHRTPRLSEMRACRPWVEAELASVSPRVVVCLGGTAAQSLLGPQARVHALRGRILTGHAWAPAVLVTVHPAAVLRAEDPAAQRSAFASLVADLSLVHRALANLGSELEL